MQSQACSIPRDWNVSHEYIVYSPVGVSHAYETKNEADQAASVGNSWSQFLVSKRLFRESLVEAPLFQEESLPDISTSSHIIARKEQSIRIERGQHTKIARVDQAGVMITDDIDKPFS